MSKSSVITARVDGETVAMVDRVAAMHGRTRSWFVSRAVAEVARREAEFMAFVQQGIEELDRDEGIPHEEVMAELDAMIAKHEARCRG